MLQLFLLSVPQKTHGTTQLTSYANMHKNTEKAIIEIIKQIEQHHACSANTLMHAFKELVHVHVICSMHTMTARKVVHRAVLISATGLLRRYSPSRCFPVQLLNKKCYI